jgi:DNA-binding XRE family transcriptional regulator
MRPTDYVTVTLKGLGKNAKTFIMPFAVGKRVEDFIAARAKPSKTEDSIPARQVLPDLADDTMRPATVLRGARYKAGLTQKSLAKRLGVHQHHLSEMENGKRPIGKQMAKRFAEALSCDYRLFV